MVRAREFKEIFLVAVVFHLAETTPLSEGALQPWRLNSGDWKMMDAGLLVTVNSDDPSYFGGYINENFLAVQRAFDLSQDSMRLLACNSFSAAFIDEDEKKRLVSEVLSHMVAED